MANLAETDPHITSLPSPTFNRETTMPRGDRSVPDAEINAKISRPNVDNNAAELAKLLGVAADAAATAGQDIQHRNDNRDAAQAALDFSEGSQNADRFAKSIAYRNAWQLQGAKKLAVDVGAEVAQQVTDRLNDSDNPATPEDIDHIIESTFQKHTTDSHGKVLDFGTPIAKLTLANALSEVRASIIPQALTAIKKQQDAKFLGTLASNSIIEYQRGAPIGTVAPDPLAPLPGAGDTIPVPTNGAPTASSGPLVEPFKGFSAMKPNSVMGAPRQGGSVHNGEDYAIPEGTALVAPMQGKVIAAFSNARGGNQVRVQMADGAIIGYAHLRNLAVRQGDEVNAGDTLGLSGKTGDATGPHVHMTVTVNGKKVSPKTYFSTASAPTGLADAPTPTPGANNQLALQTQAPDLSPHVLPPFNFEKAMAEVPPSIDKGEAKKFLLQAVINEANAKGDVGILAGLEDSKRPDGTPSFNPDEVAVIQKSREEIADKARVDAQRAQQTLWKQNGDTLLTAMVSNNPPSDDFIAHSAQAGLIDPNMAYTLIDHNKAARNEATREARQEQRQADAEADASTDAFVAGEAARMSVGDLSGDTPDAMFKSGKLGPPGKKSLSRYRQLLAAEKSGEERNRQNPEYGQYLGQIRMQYGTQQNTFLAPQFNAQNAKVNVYAMYAFFKLRVSKGAEPEEAYLETITKFGPPQDAAAARKKLIAELRAKKEIGQ